MPGEFKNDQILFLIQIFPILEQNYINSEKAEKAKTAEITVISEKAKRTEKS